MIESIVLKSSNKNTLSNIVDNQDFFRQFINYLDIKSSSVSTYTRALKRFADWLKNKNILHPTRDDIIAYRNELKEKLKPTTVQIYISVVRQFFQWCQTQGYYNNVADHVKGCKIEQNHKKDYFTSSQIKSILEGIDVKTNIGVRDYAIVSLMATCGLREIEVIRANIEDLQTKGDNTVLYVQGKGKDERTDFVIIPPQVEQNIKKYLRTRCNTNSKSPLFQSFTRRTKAAKDKRLTTRTVSQLCKKYFIKAGYDSDRLTAHSLRHTAITLSLIANDGDLRQAQMFARHSNMNTTQIYAHDLEKQDNKCSRLVADMIF